MNLRNRIEALESFYGAEKTDWNELLYNQADSNFKAGMNQISNHSNLQ